MKMNWKWVALLSLLLSAAAQAQTTTTNPPATAPDATVAAATTPTTTIPADSKEPVVVQAPAAKPVPDHHCVRETGSRIPRKGKNACMGDPGRTYTREDIEHTGAIDVADALQKLDPSISIHH